MQGNIFITDQKQRKKSHIYHFRAAELFLCSPHVFRVPRIFRSRTAFERNKTDVFRIKTHNVGPLKKLRYWTAN